MNFEVKLPLFEGPFDLLLFFIRRDELDIHDIPIARITDDFLAYIRHLEQMNLEVAGEFILVAATLMRIKAKMLLPRVDKDEEGQEIDPRAELVRHLLEYKKYKSVVEYFEKWEESMLMREKRGNLTVELKDIASKDSSVETELQDVDLYRLLKVFQRLMTKHQAEQQQPRHEVVQFPYTVEEQKSKILLRLSEQPILSFQALIEEDPTRIGMIFHFLAVLELLQLGQIGLRLGEGYNNFWLLRPEN